MGDVQQPTTLHYERDDEMRLLKITIIALFLAALAAYINEVRGCEPELPKPDDSIVVINV